MNIQLFSFTGTKFTTKSVDRLSEMGNETNEKKYTRR